MHRTIADHRCGPAYNPAYKQDTQCRWDAFSLFMRSVRLIRNCNMNHHRRDVNSVLASWPSIGVIGPHWYSVLVFGISLLWDALSMRIGPLISSARVLFLPFLLDGIYLGGIKLWCFIHTISPLFYVHCLHCIYLVHPDHNAGCDAFHFGVESNRFWRNQVLMRYPIQMISVLCSLRAWTTIGPP
jgi:hypothetical protein